MKLVHWSLVDGMLHLLQRGLVWVGPQPAQALRAVPNVTVYPSVASVPITILLIHCSAVLMCPLKAELLIDSTLLLLNCILQLSYDIIGNI